MVQRYLVRRIILNPDKEMEPNTTAELKNPYFDIQVRMGITKHPGSLKATRELAELCGINSERYVLVVGCRYGLYVGRKIKEI